MHVLKLLFSFSKSDILDLKGFHERQEAENVHRALCRSRGVGI